jgi:hypothetical protein
VPGAEPGVCWAATTAATSSASKPMGSLDLVMLTSVRDRVPHAEVIGPKGAPRDSNASALRLMLPV